jgi:hypothetical protein
MNTLQSPVDDRSKEDCNQLGISYLALRNLIGLFGMALPWYA